MNITDNNRTSKSLRIRFEAYEKKVFKGTIRPQEARRKQWESFLKRNSPSDEVTEICLKEFIPLSR